MKSTTIHHLQFLCAALAAAFVFAGSAQAYAGELSAPAALGSLLIDVTKAQSVDLLGTAGNTVKWFNIGASATVSSLDWNFTLTAYAPSWLADMQISFSSSAGHDGVDFVPGAQATGTETYTGSANLTDLGLAFKVRVDGLLRVEYTELYKDQAPGLADGQWDSGTVTLGFTAAVPEPSS